MNKPIMIGYRKVKVFVIEVQQLVSEENWDFVFIDGGNGVKQMAVF